MQIVIDIFLCIAVGSGSVLILVFLTRRKPVKKESVEEAVNRKMRGK